MPPDLPYLVLQPGDIRLTDLRVLRRHLTDCSMPPATDHAALSCVRILSRIHRRASAKRRDRLPNRRVALRVLACVCSLLHTLLGCVAAGIASVGCRTYPLYCEQKPKT